MIDPELQVFLRVWKEAWSSVPTDAPVATRRAVLERIAARNRQPLPPEFESLVDVATDGSRSVRVRIFRRRDGPAAPVLVFMHGGSWMVGSPETHDELAGAILRRTGHTVVSVDYALAPEHPFPVAFEDCLAAVRWVSANAGKLRVRADALSVGGESAGANLAAAVALQLRNTALTLRSQLLFYPPVDFTHARPSFRENGDGPLLTTSGMIEAMNAYVPDPSDRRNPLAAPLQAPEHAGLPSTFIAVAEHDPLRDDGLAYAGRLMASDVPLHLHHGVGLIHGYLRALSYSEQVRAALNEACTWMGKNTGSTTASLEHTGN